MDFSIEVSYTKEIVATECINYTYLDEIKPQKFIETLSIVIPNTEQQRIQITLLTGIINTTNDGFIFAQESDINIDNSSQLIEFKVTKQFLSRCITNILLRNSIVVDRSGKFAMAYESMFAKVTKLLNKYDFYESDIVKTAIENKLKISKKREELVAEFFESHGLVRKHIEDDITLLHVEYLNELLRIGYYISDDNMIKFLEHVMKTFDSVDNSDMPIGNKLSPKAYFEFFDMHVANYCLEYLLLHKSHFTRDPLSEVIDCEVMKIYEFVTSGQFDKLNFFKTVTLLSAWNSDIVVKCILEICMLAEKSIEVFDTSNNLYQKDWIMMLQANILGDLCYDANSDAS